MVRLYLIINENIQEEDNQISTQENNEDEQARLMSLTFHHYHLGLVLCLIGQIGVLASAAEMQNDLNVLKPKV